MSILEMLGQQIDDQTIAQMSRQLGIDQKSTSKAVNAALPMLVGALANNASQSGGAQALAGALDRNHDGSVLDDIVGFLGQGSQAQNMGQAILGHILGGRQQNAEQAVGQVAGMDRGTAGQLLAMLAPLVMGALAKQKQSKDLGAGDLATMLGRERRQVEKAQPGAGSLLSQVLDRDGDGDITDDLAQIGGSLLSSFLSKRS